MIQNIPPGLFQFASTIDVAEVNKTGLRILEEIGIPLPSEKTLRLPMKIWLSSWRFCRPCLESSIERYRCLAGGSGFYDYQTRTRE